MMTGREPLGYVRHPFGIGLEKLDYHLEEEICIAAWDSRLVVGPQWGEARLITAAGYDRLLVYHSGCRDTLLESREEGAWRWFGAHSQ